MRYKENKINNIEELRLEIVRLKLLAKSQELYLEHQYHTLKEKIDAPVRFVNSALSWIPGVDLARELFGSAKDGDKKDWVSRIFSVGSTALLNRLFLRRAGLFKRILMSTLTQQAAGKLNKDRLISLFKSVVDYIRPSADAPESVGVTDPISPGKRTFRRNKARKTAVPESEPTMAPDFGIPPGSETS